MTNRLTLDGEIAPAESVPADLALRDTRVPATLDQLAAQKEHALEILEARITVLETSRRRAIRMTHPPDWNLYKDREGVVIAYLSDGGCERVRDILGVEVYDVSAPEKMANGDGSFMYLQRANGRSKLTTQVVEAMEGGRSSTEDFCRDAKGAQLELLVRKATRANLDGNIARELMGLRNVPLTELQEAWQGTSKDWNQCRKARGFGSAEERLGATREGVPDVPPPTCPVCKTPDGKLPLPLEYRGAKGTRGAFYGCRFYAKHPQQKVFVDAADWVAKQRASAVKTFESENAQLDAEIAAREGQS